MTAIMLNGLKTYFKDHFKTIMATVIGGLIFAIVIAFWKKTILFLSDNEALKVIAAILSKEVHLSVYWLPLLFIAGFVLAFILFKLAVLFNKKVEYYTKDVVFGLIWEWDTYNFATSLTALCPKCKAELKFDESYDEITYRCARCCFDDMHFPRSREDTEEVVRIEIEKRERTGEYKKAAKRLKSIDDVRF